MLIGYGRTSTIEQKAGLEAQVRELTAAGCQKLFTEQLSSVDAKRVKLEEAINFCREGDVLVCTKLDRLARSVAGFVEIQKRLEEKGVALKVLAMGLDTSTPTGRLNFNIIASIAQFEREIMLERQREGIAKAAAEGKYKGRVPTARNQAPKVLELLQGGMKPAEVAQQFGMSERSVFRIMAANKPQEASTAA